MPPSYSTDIVIFGGGVAGLWLLNRLTAEGYQAILLERDRLGGGQSINSQGIIHGGLKYALHGALSGASRAIADMPRRWRDCIEGHGEIDLSACRVLSEQYYMWSGPGFGSGLKTFFGSKAVAGKANLVASEETPEILRGSGVLYRLPDFVIDSLSLIEALSAPQKHRIFTIANDSEQFVRQRRKRDLLVEIEGNLVELKANRYVFCAGQGNERLIGQANLDNPPSCQTRPLKMVSVSGASLPPLFLHVLGKGLSASPALTITSHGNAEEETVWYLGGDLAEKGVSRSDAEQEESAKRLLRHLFPMLDFENLSWSCFDIDRAEPASPRGGRPDNATIVYEEDIIVAWPTKLTLAPPLGDMVVERLTKDGIRPGAENTLPATAAPPPLGRPFWD